MASQRTIVALSRSAIASTRFSSSQPSRRCLHTCRVFPAAPRTFPTRPSTSLVQRRLHSSEPPNKTKVYEFDDMKAIVSKPSPTRIVIDVREPSEFGEGHIPSATNMPIKSSPDALFLPEDEFEDKFGFEKPGKDQEVIFYCRSGVRSSAAAQLAGQNGYQNISEYRGSWLDWESKGGEKA